MRNKVFLFIALFVSSLMIVPAHNFLNRGNDSQKFSPDAYLKKYFNIDFVLSVIGGAGNFIGYSIDEEKVIIGKHGWLYLGNQFGETIVKKIAGYNGKYRQDVSDAGVSVKSWDDYLKKLAVINYIS